MPRRTALGWLLLCFSQPAASCPALHSAHAVPGRITPPQGSLSLAWRFDARKGLGLFFPASSSSARAQQAQAPEAVSVVVKRPLKNQITAMCLCGLSALFSSSVPLSQKSDIPVFFSPFLTTTRTRCPLFYSALSLQAPRDRRSPTAHSHEGAKKSPPPSSRPLLLLCWHAGERRCHDEAFSSIRRRGGGHALAPE